MHARELARCAVLGFGLAFAASAAAQSSAEPGATANVEAAAPAASPEPATPAPADAGNVLVQVSGCEVDAVDPDKLVRAVDLELSALGLRATAVPVEEQAALAAVQRAPAVVELSCNGRDDVLIVRVSDAVSGHELSQHLDTRGVDPDARPRTLALAVVSLLEASWSRAALEPKREQAPLPAQVRAALLARMQREPTPAPAIELEPQREPARPFAELSATLRAFPGRNTGLLGPRASVMPALSRSIEVPISAEVLYGTSELSDAIGTLGSMDLYWLTLGLGLQWVAGSEMSFSLGPELRAGVALADAEAERDMAAVDDEGGFVLTTLLGCDLRMPLGASYFGSLGADLGYTPLGVVFLGDAARLSGMADATFALRIGIAR